MYFRAVFGNEKISTVVPARDVNKFQVAYCNLIKSNMDGLKRQKKTKAKKATKETTFWNRYAFFFLSEAFVMPKSNSDLYHCKFADPVSPKNRKYLLKVFR